MDVLVETFIAQLIDKVVHTNYVTRDRHRSLSKKSKTTKKMEELLSLIREVAFSPGSLTILRNQTKQNGKQPKCKTLGTKMDTS